MPSGKAPTAERLPRHRHTARPEQHERPEPIERESSKPLPRGLSALLTALFWGVWAYLVLPLASVLLWVFGGRLFFSELSAGGYDALLESLVAYSTVYVVLFGLLVTWIGWNIMCYGGSNDRRTVKKPRLSNEEVRRAFGLDPVLLAHLRSERLVRLDLDERSETALIPEIHPVRPLPPPSAPGGPEPRA